MSEQTPTPDPTETSEPAGTTETVEPTAAPAPSPASIPTPAAIPSPSAIAARMASRPPAQPAASPTPASESARFGRVEPDGTVFVTIEGEEHEVGSYPGAEPEDALQYFARKFDELSGTADLIAARAENPEVPAKELSDALKALKEHLEEGKVVGDVAALRSRVGALDAVVAERREHESAQRAAARAEAITTREALVAEAEQIAAQPEGSTQWKRSSERMRELLDAWKTHQRQGARIDKPTENALWQRFSHARNSFDKARKGHFATLEQSRGEAKATKERLVGEAERLASSKDWASTARAFKDLMGQWRTAGRAARGDDDALWERFKSAQDAFFAAKDQVAAAEDEEFRGNLGVKEGLIAEAESLLPITDLEAAKAALRTIQDKWDRAGKVPRADIDRTEKALRRVESAVREAEDKKWKASNPEVAARANSMVTQLESSIASLTDDVAKARAKGNEKKVAELTAKIEAQQQWLDQAKAGLDEFGR